MVHKELFGGSGIPDTGLEFCLVWQFDFLRASFPAVCVERFLDLVNDRYIGDRGTLRAVPTLAFLVLKTVKYSVSFGHFLEVIP